MKILRNALKYNLPIRTEKDFPIEGIEFIDINTLLMDSNIYNDITNEFLKEILDKSIDYIVSPEARGFLFGCPVATKANIPFIPARKKGKLPPTTIETENKYKKEYGVDYLYLPKLLNESYSNKTFYIIDDIYATGNTAIAIKEAIEKLGGIVLGIGVLINIKELNNDKLFSIIDVNEEN